MRKRCPCSDVRPNGASCGAQLTYGDYANLRRDRSLMDPGVEYDFRNTELKAAVAENADRPRLRISSSTGTKLVCLQAYIDINGLPENSIQRKWK